jgi:hypothetical protein
MARAASRRRGGLEGARPGVVEGGPPPPCHRRFGAIPVVGAEPSYGGPARGGAGPGGARGIGRARIQRRLGRQREPLVQPGGRVNGSRRRPDPIEPEHRRDRGRPQHCGHPHRVVGSRVPASVHYVSRSLRRIHPTRIQRFRLRSRWGADAAVSGALERTAARAEGRFPRLPPSLRLQPRPGREPRSALRTRRPMGFADRFSPAEGSGPGNAHRCPGGAQRPQLPCRGNGFVAAPRSRACRYVSPDLLPGLQFLGILRPAAGGGVGVGVLLGDRRWPPLAGGRSRSWRSARRPRTELPRGLGGPPSACIP